MSGVAGLELAAVTAMVVTYAFEKKSPWFILGFAASCQMASVFSFMQDAWPFGIAEMGWSFAAFRRWLDTMKEKTG